MELLLPGPVDFVQTLGPLQHGRHDPTTQVTPDEVWRTSRTPEGPATLRIARLGRDRVKVEAWGNGAAWMIAEAPGLLGFGDPGVPFSLAGGPLEEVARHVTGLRLPKFRRV